MTPFSLTKTCSAWNDENLTKVLNAELITLPIEALPLQQGLSHSSVALQHRMSATILRRQEDSDSYFIHAGLFYTGIISGCSCTDDPTPQDEVNEYCEVLLCINKRTGAASAELSG